MANTRKTLLTQEEDNQLLVAFTNCKDGEMRTKIQAIRLYGKNRPVSEIIEITGLPRRTINRWYSRYLNEGLKAFVDNRRGGNHKYLSDDQIQELQDKLHQYRPVDVLGRERSATADGLYWSVTDLRQAVKHWYGITYQSNTSYQQLFKKCGFSYQRPAKVFRSRREVNVAVFEEQLEKK